MRSDTVLSKVDGNTIQQVFLVYSSNYTLKDIKHPHNSSTHYHALFKLKIHNIPYHKQLSCVHNNSIVVRAQQIVAWVFPWQVMVVPLTITFIYDYSMDFAMPVHKLTFLHRVNANSNIQLIYKNYCMCSIFVILTLSTHIIHYAFTMTPNRFCLLFTLIVDLLIKSVFSEHANSFDFIYSWFCHITVTREHRQHGSKKKIKTKVICTHKF